MKKKLIAFLLFAVIGAMGLVSCGGDDVVAADGGEIVSYGKEISLIHESANVSDDDMWKLTEVIWDKTRVDPKTGDGQSEKGKNEIVVGATDREISKVALKKLDASVRRAIKLSDDSDFAEDDLAGFAIYSDGASVAIVWSSHYFASLAVDYFIENYLSGDSLELEEGYVKTEIVSISAYLKERGDKIKADAWVALAEQLPADKSDAIIAAMKQLYGLYTDDMVIWLANLYDPGTGGFYWSNSARDNVGFLPDIESTYLALVFMKDSGMAEMYDGDWGAATPEWLSEQICNWFLSLQDPDGYFYNPQWPKEYIEKNGFQTRITRDLGSATGLLEKFGKTPTYSAVSYNAPATPLTNPLGVSKVTAVSKAVYTAGGMMEQFQSTENFRAYINNLDEKAKLLDDAGRAYQFYAWGNEFQSVISKLTPEMKTILIEFFDKYQDPNTGLWSKQLSYDSTNGMHKLGAVYNSCGASLKYTDKMIESAVTLLSSSPDEMPVSAAVTVYNALSGIYYVYENIRNYGEGSTNEKEEIISGYKALVYENAATIINNAIVHTSGFGYSDGSFGNNLNTVGSAATAQGVPVAVKGAKEGDISGTILNSSDIVTYLMKALDLPKYTVPLFTESERYLYMNTLADLGSVLKRDEVIVERQTFDFEDAQSGSDIPDDISMVARNSDVFIEERELGDKQLVVRASNWYSLEGSGTTKRNAYFEIRAGSVARGASVGVVEAVMSFDGISSTSKAPFIIAFCSNKQGYIAEFSFNVIRDGANYFITIVDNEGRDLGIRLPAGGVEMKLRIEYYRNEAKFKIYVEDSYLTETTAMNTAGLEFDSCLFNFVGHASMTATFDDIVVNRDNIKHELHAEGTPPTFPLPVKGKPVYNFGDVDVGTRYPKDMSVTQGNGTVSVRRSGANNYLNVLGSDGNLDANPKISIYNYTVAESGNAYVLESTLKFNSDAKKASYSNVVRFQLVDVWGSEILTLRVRERLVGEETEFVLVDKDDVDNVLATFKKKEQINLRAVYFPSAKAVMVYVNGQYTGMSINSDSGAAVANLNIRVEMGAGVNLDIDNLGMTRQDVTLERPDNPDGEESPVTPNGTHKPEISAGTAVENFQGDYSGISAAGGAGNSIEMATGTVVKHEGTTNENGARATIVTDGANKYLNIVAGKRVNAKGDRSHIINLPVSPTGGLFANAYVWEADLFIRSKLKDGTATGSDSFQLLVYNGKDYIQYDAGYGEDGFVTLGGVKIAAKDEWFTLRLEFVVGESNARVYVKNSEGLYELRGTLADVDYPYCKANFEELGGSVSSVLFGGLNSKNAINISIDNLALYTAEVNVTDEEPIIPPELPTVNPDEPEEGDSSFPWIDGDSDIPDSSDSENMDNEGWIPVETVKPDGVIEEANNNGIETIDPNGNMDAGGWLERK